MPSWILKAAVQGGISWLPSSHRVNELLQRLNGSLTLTDQRLAEKYRVALLHVEAAARHGRGMAGLRVLEVGTGWHPIVPIALMLHGAERVITADITSLLSLRRTLDAIERFRTLEPAEQYPWSKPARERLESIRSSPHGSVEDVLGAIGIEVRIGRVSELALRPGDIDFVVSNNTLEHVQPHELGDMMRALRRLSHDGVVASHHIDLCDHYAQFDSSIDVYHFLRYSDRAWRPFNNHLHYQNRLRAPDYRRLLDESGWRVIEENAHRASDGPAGPIAARFRSTEASELAISEMHVVAGVA